MAIENLPLFSAMNREEVKPPFPHPHRPLTSQESHFAIMEKVNACIAEVNHFEQRIRYEMEQFIARTETENTGFKEAIQASYNAFMETVQKEMNNFETDMQNNFDLYRNDIDKRVADFQTAINNEFETLQTNVLKASNGKIQEMEELKISLNKAYSDFKAEVNVAIENFKTIVNQQLSAQDKKIEDYKKYMVDNILANTETIFNQKASNGEIAEIMASVYGNSRTFKGSATYNEIQAITNASNGDYYYCTTDEHYYQRTETAWVDIGNGDISLDGLLAFQNWCGGEVVDARTAKSGKTFETLGEAIREMTGKQPIELTWGNHEETFISTQGIVTTNEQFRVSDAVPVVEGETYLFETKTANQYIRQVCFSLESTLSNSYVMKANPLIVDPETDDVDTPFEVTAPEGAKFMFVTWQTTYEGREPKLYRVNNNAFDAISKLFANNVFKMGGDKVEIVYNDNVGWYVSGMTWINLPQYEFSMSDAIPVKEGEVLIYTCSVVNESVAHMIFTSSAERNNANIIQYIQNASKGTFIVVVPKGATHVFVKNDTYGNGTSIGATTLQKTGYNLFDVLVPLVVSTANTFENVKISLPDVINLVENETFEMFYNGFINANDLNNYNIRISCTKGKAYKRKYVFTPKTEDIGTHIFGVRIYDNNDFLLAERTITLNVVPELSTTSANNVLCIGDSLTADGQWVLELRRLLHEKGLTNVNFIGRRGNTAKYEATGGYSFNIYLSNDAEMNPFYNVDTGEVDIANYVNTYGNGKLDTVIILLGWNSTGYGETAYKEQTRNFIDILRADFPDVKILLYGLQVPSIDGFGENYGTSWNFKDKLNFVFNLNTWLTDIANEYENIRFVNIASQFDTLYSMPHEERKVNKRSSTMETVGINGVHPNSEGYMQIADVGYRELMALLQ